MPQFDPPRLYAHELSNFSGKWLGYPLWYPEPDDRGEVQIGDVGHIFKGRFRRFFNVLEPIDASDPQRPKSGTLSHNKDYGVDKRTELGPGAYASDTVNIVKGKASGGVVDPISGSSLGLSCEFESNSRRGAVLHLEEYAISETVVAKGTWQEYLGGHWKTWAPFIKDTYKVDLDPRSIVLVTGFVKSSRWAVAAFQSRKFSLKTSLKAGFSFVEGNFAFNVTKHRGVHKIHLAGPRNGRPRHSDRDQCIFLDFLEVESSLLRLRGGVGSADESSEDDSESLDVSCPGSDDDDDDDDDDPLPCACLRRYILERSNAKIAIAGHGDLELLLGAVVAAESDTSASQPVRAITLANVENYVRDENVPIDVDENQVGTLSLIGLVQRAQVRRERLRWQSSRGCIEIQAPRRWIGFPLDPPDRGSRMLKHDAVDVTQTSGNESGERRENEKTEKNEKMEANEESGDVDVSHHLSLASPPSPTSSETSNGVTINAKVIDSEDEVDDEDISESIMLADGRTYRWLDIWFKYSGIETAHPSFSILNNGEYIVTCGTADGVILWDCRTGNYVRHFSTTGEHSAQQACAVAFSSNEMVVGSAFVTAPKDAAIIAPTALSTKFVTASEGFAPIIWSIEGEKLLELREGQGASSVAYSPIGQTIAAALPDEVAYLWTPNGKLIRTLRYGGETMALEYSPDGKSLAIAADASAYLWNCEDGTQLASFRGHERTIRGMKFSHQGDQIVTVSDDRTVRIWDVRTGDELVKIEHMAKIWAVDFSPDGQAIVSGSSDGSTVVISNSAEGWQTTFTTDAARHSGAIYSLAYSHDGRFFASGDDRGRVKVWIAKTGAFMAEFRGHQARVRSVVWTPDDKAVVSSSEDGTVRSWSVYDARRFL